MQMVSDEANADLNTDREQASSRPKLFEIDTEFDCIFVVCSGMHALQEVHDTVMAKQNEKYWKSVPLVLIFALNPLINEQSLQQFCDILDTLKENITTVAVQMSFDVLMSHIEYEAVSAFTHKILECAQTYSLWRLRVSIQYKHCDADMKWHQLMHKLITSYMTLHIEHDDDAKFRKSGTLRLGIRAMDFILYWKLQHDAYQQFMQSLQSSTCIGHLLLEFASLYQMQQNYSAILSNLFHSISQNVSISGMALKICADDTDWNDSGGLTQNDEDLTSLLGNTDEKMTDLEEPQQDASDSTALSFIYDCFRNKKIAAEYGGHNACWKTHFSYKFSIGCSRKDFALRVNSKYGINSVLQAIQQNDELCLNCLVLENVLYDHEESAVSWDDPFAQQPESAQSDSNRRHNVWNELLAVCCSDRHFVEILEFAESKIGKTYCQDLQRFFQSIIHGKQCHLRKLQIHSVSQHGTDVFVEYLAELMQRGMCFNPMLSEINVEFEYIGSLQIFTQKIHRLTKAAVFRMHAMVESQLGIERYLRDELGFSFGVVQLILQLCRFQSIHIQIYEHALTKYVTENAAQRSQYARQLLVEQMRTSLQEYDGVYAQRDIARYLQWQYKDTLDEERAAKYVPSELSSKYLPLVCAADVCLEIGFASSRSG